MPVAEKINLVFIPGLLTDKRVFAPQVKALADIANCTVADIDGADSIAALAKSVLARAPHRFALAGFSMGGYIALEIMRQARERVQALALISTSARPDTPEASAARKAAMVQAEAHFQVVVDEIMPKFVHPSRMRYHSNVTTVYAMGLRVGKDAYLRQQRAIMGRIDSRPFLHQITCPTLILCGQDDVITPVAVHEELAAGIPGAELQILKDSAHILTIGRPAAANKALRSWLGRVDPATS